VVAIKVEPLFGETGGSVFRRGLLTALVGVGGQATVRFQGDVRGIILRRNGEVVEPLREGHAPVRIGINNELIDFSDVADFGYYVFSPEVFRPNGPQRAKSEPAPEGSMGIPVSSLGQKGWYVLRSPEGPKAAAA
jgi:hypothetical protein